MHSFIFDSLYIEKMPVIIICRTLKHTQDTRNSLSQALVRIKGKCGDINNLTTQIIIPPLGGRPIKENLISFKKTLTYQPKVVIHMDKLKDV